MRKLILTDFHCFTYLGATLEERQQLQEIIINLQLEYLVPPLGEKSDNLSEVEDYDILLKSVEKFCIENSFALLERLTYALGEYLLPQFKFIQGLFLSVSKITPLARLKRATYQASWEK